MLESDLTFTLTWVDWKPK